MSQTVNYENLLQRLFDLDEHIRFAAVANMQGNVVASVARDNVDLYLSPSETQETIQHAISAWKSRMKHYDKIGLGLYTLAVYEKLRRMTAPLPSGNLLLVTIDNMGGQKQIVDKILNEVRFLDYTIS